MTLYKFIINRYSAYKHTYAENASYTPTTKDVSMTQEISSVYRKLRASKSFYLHLRWETPDSVPNRLSIINSAAADICDQKSLN